MSIYEDEMFKYMTKKENFEVAFEISELFPQVKNKLIEEFWKKVNSNLIKMTDSLDWKIDLDEEIFSTYSSLYVGRDKWKESFYTCYEKLHEGVYYGLWFDCDDSTLDANKIRKYSERIECLQETKKSKHWLGYRLIGENFNSIKTLKKILPDSREDFSNELADFLYRFTEEIKPDIEKMNKMRIK